MYRRALLSIGLIAALAIPTASAQAQSARTFVSGKGADTGTCGVTAPCRSFAYAITQTANEGEIVVLDSAGYGAVTIAQSLSITNPGGVEAGVTATSGNNAITINATPTSVVTLRGLTLEGGGVGTNGISVTSTLPLSGSSTVASVNIAGCVIKDFTGIGIDIDPSASGSTGHFPLLNVVVADSLVWNNQSSGIALTMPLNTTLSALIDRTGVDENGTGISVTATGGINALLTSMHAFGNATDGIAINNGTVVLKSSTIYASRTNNDILASNGTLYLFNNNSIGTLSNAALTLSDGTNNINSATGNPLQSQKPQ